MVQYSRVLLRATTAVLLFAACAATTTTTASAQAEWELRHRLDDMATYTRDRAGSEIKEVKLVMTVDADIAAINAVLDDAPRQTEWVYKCSAARDLGGRVDTGWYYYSRIDMPWPLEDRDLVARVTGGVDGDTYSSVSTAAPDRIARADDAVRITDFDVRTSYRELGGGRTEVTYVLHSEPGGRVPAWLVNLFVDRGPVETMTRLRELVEGPRSRTQTAATGPR